MGKACGSLQLCQMIDQRELARILVEPAVVSFMQRNEVVIHTGKGVYISMEILIAITATIQLKLVCDVVHT